LATGSENCRSWCEAQVSRQCSLYRSFLHLFQDLRHDTPGGLDIDFVSKTREVDEAWLQREEEMRGSDAAFHECEKGLTKKWEEKRLELTAERDVKIKQLMEQAERSQTRAEKQLLMQQAKLFGQRMDTQIERAWEDQRKERDERWAQHSQAKQESRQVFKDRSLMMQQEAEGVASAADRFQDMARARLGGPEDTWARNVEKFSTVSASALKGHGLFECLKAAGLLSPVLPKEGTQFAGINTVAEAVEDLMSARVDDRKGACKEFEEHTLQQLRHCVERFIQHEGMQQQKKNPKPGDDIDKPQEYTHAVTIQSLLHARQHRVVADTMRRQFHDFMLVLRMASLSAVHLLPEGIAKSFSSRDAKLDLPSVPAELKQDLASGGSSGYRASDAVDQLGVEDNEVLKAEQVEGQFMYDALMRRLLERLLTPMHSKHRDELLDLKRSHAKEIRQSLQHLCQLEPACVDKSTELDIEEYKTQIKTKLLSDCEYHVCEERRSLSEQVDAEVDMHVRIYQHQIAEEERSALRDRRKWLTERLVVMQAQGAGCPGDRAVIQHLRAELRACELRFEMRDRELMDGDEPLQESALEPQNKKPQRASPVPQVVQPVPQRASPVPRGMQPTQQSPRQAGPTSNAGQAANIPLPAPPSTQPPANRRPSPGSGQKAPNDMTFPIGRASRGSSPKPMHDHSAGTPPRSADFQHPANPAGKWSEDLAGAGPPSPPTYDLCHDPSPRADSGRKRPPAATIQQSPRKVSDKAAAMDSPSFGERWGSGADGAAGFGKKPPSPSFGEELDSLKRCPSFGEGPGMVGQQDAIMGTNLALYDWPFAASEVMCELGPKQSANELPDVFLPPLKRALARPIAPEPKAFDVGSYSAGISLGGAPAGSSFKSPRPQMLPPVVSPRAR